MKASLMNFFVAVSLFLISGVFAALNPPSEEILDSLFNSCQGEKDLKELRRYFIDPCFSDEYLWNIYEEGKRTRHWCNIAIGHLLSNSLASGRGKLYKRFFELTKDPRFESSDPNCPHEVVVFLDAISLPHFSVKGVELQEFKDMVKIAVGYFGEEIAQLIFSNSTNLNLIKFAEGRFPAFHFESFNMDCLDSTIHRYGLSIADVRPLVEYYLEKGAIQKVLDSLDIENFTEVSLVLVEALHEAVVEDRSGRIASLDGSVRGNVIGVLAMAQSALNIARGFVPKPAVYKGTAKDTLPPPSHRA